MLANHQQEVVRFIDSRRVSIGTTSRRADLQERRPQVSGTSAYRVPVYGTIPAGLPTDARQEADGCISVDVETLRLPKGARVFALKVRGDSMIGAGILPGDFVVLEFREPRSNEIVAALVDGETTLKRFVMRKGRPFLKAENPRYPNLIPAHELVIQGVQIALLRVLKSY